MGLYIDQRIDTLQRFRAVNFKHSNVRWKPNENKYTSKHSYKERKPKHDKERKRHGCQSLSKMTKEVDAILDLI